MYKRYANIEGILATIPSVNELRGFLNHLYSEIRDEEIMTFYLHRQSYMDMSYTQYREEVLRQTRPAIAEAEQKAAVEKAARVIKLRPKEVGR